MNTETQLTRRSISRSSSIRAALVAMLTPRVRRRACRSATGTRHSPGGEDLARRPGSLNPRWRPRCV